jgi:hypothetical protein
MGPPIGQPSGAPPFMSWRAHGSQTTRPLGPDSVETTTRTVPGRWPQARHVGSPLRGKLCEVSCMKCLFL